MGALADEVWLSVSMPPPAAARNIRVRAHVSRTRIAAELGVHAITVARWERGTRAPRGDLRVRYARLLRQLDDVATSAERTGTPETS